MIYTSTCNNIIGPQDKSELSASKILLAVAAGRSGAANVDKMVQKFYTASTASTVIIFAYDDFNWNSFDWSGNAIIIAAKGHFF